jgi:hypothetical protein
MIARGFGAYDCLFSCSLRGQITECIRTPAMKPI